MARTADLPLRRPRWRTVLVVVLVAVVAAWLGRGGLRDLLELERGPDTAAENDLLGRLNDLRGEKGLPALQVHPQLVDKARRWSAQMAQEHRLYHSKLSDGAPPEWERLGENIGQGGAPPSIHGAWVASQVHYRNLSDPGFTHVGIGVAADEGGVLYATQVFMREGQPESAAPRPAPPDGTVAAPPPAPAPRPATPPAPRPRPPAPAPAPRRGSPAPPAVPAPVMAAPVAAPRQPSAHLVYVLELLQEHERGP